MQHTNMKPFLLLVHILLLLFQSAKGINTLYPGQSLSVGQTLTSTNGIFVLGFINSYDNFYYNSCLYDWAYYCYCIGIWYNELPSQNLVWHTCTSSPIRKLVITIHGDLWVHGDEQSVMIWSSRSSSNFNSTKLVLENTGNLVMTSISNASKVLWQSFDHPTTDTWLPGAKLGFSKLTKASQVYESPSGDYSFDLDTEKMDTIRLKNNDRPYGVCRVNGSSFTCSLDLDWYKGEVDVLVSKETNVSYVSTENEAYLTYSVTNSTILTRFVILDNGLFAQEVWSEDYQEWVPSKLRLSDTYCDQFAVYNYKRDYLHSSSCSSAPGPLSSAATSNALLPHGQQESIIERSRKSILQCHGGEKEGFILFHNASLPFNLGTFPQVSTKQCKLACLEICSCIGYVFGYGIQGACYIWEENLLGGIQYSPGLDLHIRLAGDATTITTKPNSRISLRILGPAIGGISLSIALAFLIWKRQSTKVFNASKAMDSSLMVFKYSDLRRATKNFTSKLGEGGFGSVYKGALPKSSDSIAVKKLKVHLQEEKQFRAEVRTLGIIHHVNLVKLRGFCVNGTNRFLVYDHMPHGSLDKHLFGGNPFILDWSTRYQIAVGVAKGLTYLNDECRECIIHCDIKPENILLDAAFNPKLADFGLAKLLGRNFSRVLTTMRGTRGYLAPEWISGIEITAKADVYSYGMMLFEIISGKRNWSLRMDGEDDYTPYRVMQRLTGDGDVMGLLDSKLEGNANTEEFIRTCKVAGWCIQDDESNKPSMRHIVQILEGISEVNIPAMPRFLQYVGDVPGESKNVASLSSWANSGNITGSSNSKINNSISILVQNGP